MKRASSDIFKKSLPQWLMALTDPKRKKFHASVIASALFIHLVLHYATYVPALRPLVGNLPYFKLHMLHEAEFLVIVVYACLVLGFKAGIITVVITGVTSVPFILSPFIFGRDPRPDELRDLSIQVAFILGMGTTIAILFEINEKRRKAESRLEAFENAKDMKDKFASIAAHELRTPLTTIQGFSELLLRQNAPDETKQYWIELIHKQSTRLGTLVRDMLDASRIDSGNMEFQLEPINLKDVIQECVNSIPRMESGGSLSTLVPEGMPKVIADHTRLAQVLMNLIENAIKYSPEKRKIVIYAHYTKMVGPVHICVQDNGIGMSDEEQMELFTPFYRVRNIKTEHIPGTGLGLYLVKSYVNGMGGDVDVKSAPGKGTTFTVSMPIEPVSTPSRQAKSKKQVQPQLLPR